MAQWCIEEALMERLEWVERLAKQGDPEAPVSPHAQAGAEHAAQIAQFARGV